MAVYKYNPAKTWFVKCCYKTHIDEVKYYTKQSLDIRRAAINWEHNFLAKHNGQLDMTFVSFVELCEANQASRLRESTTYGKDTILRAKIHPVFGEKKLMDITPAMIMQWRNDLLSYRGPQTGKPYAPLLHSASPQPAQRRI